MTEQFVRKVAIRDAKMRKHVQDRIGEGAKKMSERADLAARIELCNEAMCNFITQLYEKDEAGWYKNLEKKTFRINLAVPWGDSGWKQGGLRRAEARILSQILRKRVEEHKVVLFDYNFYTREWFLEVSLFRTKNVALDYIEKAPITIEEWDKNSEQVRQPSTPK